jgi:curli production assembly/transport component CsgF
MRFSKWTVMAIVFILTGGTASASELVYTPVNPAFGGNPFNADYLLGVAGAINQYKDPSTSQVSGQRTTAQEFERIIQSSLLSRISTEIANQIYGENSADQGRFVIGGTTVDFLRTGNQTKVTVSDSATGGSTIIEIPTPGL